MVKGNISLIVHAKRKVSVLAGQEAARVSSNNVEWREGGKNSNSESFRLENGPAPHNAPPLLHRCTERVVLEGKGQGRLG